MSDDWHLYVTIGTTADYYDGRTYLALEADPYPAVDPDAPPVLPKLVSATWRHLLEEDGSWPAVQGPSTGSVSIVFATAAEAAEVRAGAPITLRLWHPVAGAPAPVSMFSGRISAPELQPHRLGVVATFGLSDHLAPLSEETAGEDDYATGVTQYGMLAGLFTEAGLNPPDPPGTVELVYGALRGRDPEPASLLALAQETVAAALMLGPDDEHRLYELRPNLHPSLGNLDPDEPYILTPLPREAAESDATLAAGDILAGGKWTRSLFTDINTVHIISGDKVVARANNRLVGEPPVTLRRPSQAVSGAATADLAEYLLPPAEWVPGWEAETFTVPLEKLDAGSWPGQLRDVLTVTDIPVHHNPNGSAEWTGVITGIETRVASLGPGRPRVEIGLTLSDRPFVAPPPPPPTYRELIAALGPSVSYRLNESAIGTGALLDSSGNLRHGNLISAGAFNIAGSISGDTDTAMTRPVATVASATWMNVTTIAGHLRVRFTGAIDPSNGDAVVGRYGPAPFLWLVWRNTTGKIALQFSISGTLRNVATTVTATLNQWYSVGWTYDGTTIRLYIDGVEVATGAFAGTLSTGARELSLGRYSNNLNTDLQGDLDDLDIWFGGTLPTAADFAELHATATAP